MSWRDIGFPDPAGKCGCGTSPPPCASNPIKIDAVLDDPCAAPSYGSSRFSATFTVYDGSGAVVGTITTGVDGTSATGSGPLSVTTPISGGRISMTSAVPCDTIAPADQAVNATSCGGLHTYTFAPTLQPWAICCSYGSGSGGPQCSPLSSTLTGTINGHTFSLSRGTGAGANVWSGTLSLPATTDVYTPDGHGGCTAQVGVAGTASIAMKWGPCTLFNISVPVSQYTGHYIDPTQAAACGIPVFTNTLKLVTSAPYTLTWNPLYTSVTDSTAPGADNGTSPWLYAWYNLFGWSSVTFSAGE